MAGYPVTPFKDRVLNRVSETVNGLAIPAVLDYRFRQMVARREAETCAFPRVRRVRIPGMKKRDQADRTSGRFCCVPLQCAAIMKVLSEAPRLLLIRALISGPCHVAVLAEQTGLTPARVSHHLARMRLAGVVECTREGQTVVYRIVPRIAVPDGLDLGCCRIQFRKL